MISQSNKILLIDPADNVLVALQTLEKDTTIEWKGESIVLAETIPAKHKFFLRDMQVGEEIFMYGVLVGKLLQPVIKGSRMSTSNTGHAAQPYAYRNVHDTWTPPPVEKFSGRTFNGFHRSNGQVGTANYWLFIPTVFCENRNLDVIREVLHNELGYSVTRSYQQFTHQLLLAHQQGKDLSQPGSFEPDQTASSVRDRPFKNVDGIKFLNHQGGCGGTRQDSAVLGNLLAAYATHPNVGGITLLSLGCQHLQVSDLLDDIKKRDPSFDKPLFIFEQQQTKSEEDLIRDSIRQTFTGLAQINQLERQPAPLSELCIGVKCGGSDGFSGISANPAVGYAADLLVALGGKVLLAEFPELCGAEQNILDRCTDESIAAKFVQLMETYDADARRTGSGFYMNPSPGNIRDGLITDAIKSAGAAKKGGTSPVVDVLDYTEPATRAGLSLVCTPGNDVEATTGKAASGATLILFTTGLGTPTGNPVTPVIKVSSNTSLANRMKDIIDINTGDIIEGKTSIEKKGEEILEYCIRAASGEVIPKAVLLNQDDFIPWKRGVSL
ncbi:MAG: altronate dehydratase [Chitinophagaceae bacterium]|nr:MAG: altronate dehydratase [Chitinophagaceae bacterium]